MQKFYASFLALSILFLSSGCATIVGGGGHQDVDIQSEPAGAEVFVDGVSHGKTPVSASLERRDTHQLKFKKEGYSEEVVLTRKKMNPWIWGNLVIGGIIGILVDVSTGAANKISPSNYYVVMTQEKPAQTPVAIPEPQTQAEPKAQTQIPAESKTQIEPQSSNTASVVKLPAQSETQSQTAPVSDSIVQAGEKADLSAVSGTSTTPASQENAQSGAKSATQATLAPVPAQK